MDRSNNTPFEYFLPNGRKIDMKGFMEALNTNLKNEHAFAQFYLDTETGNICIIEDIKALISLVEKIGQSQRYISITSMYDEDYAEILDFLLNAIHTDFISKENKKKALEILSRNGWKECVEYVNTVDQDFKRIFDREVDEYKMGYVENYMNDFPNGKIVRKFSGCENCKVCKKLKEEGAIFDYYNDSGELVGEKFTKKI